MPEGDPTQAVVDAEEPVIKWNGAIISRTPLSTKDLKNPYLHSLYLDIAASRILAYNNNRIHRTRAMAMKASAMLLEENANNKEALASFWTDICLFLIDCPCMGSPLYRGKAPAPVEDAGGPAPRSLWPELSSPSLTLKSKADPEDVLSTLSVLRYVCVCVCVCVCPLCVCGSGLSFLLHL